MLMLDEDGNMEESEALMADSIHLNSFNEETTMMASAGATAANNWHVKNLLEAVSSGDCGSDFMSIPSTSSMNYNLLLSQEALSRRKEIIS